ncbi:hypothetical protein NQ317_019035 [Molorchus minor]|uniref:Uncharacterized protein n=1 Tax=Molorchus minor TaxID=1323400 RepID=A0ABQ9IRY9_9CUCU|nr:hypothetical protein NQ317_019035 [Molorchus minor]
MFNEISNIATDLYGSIKNWGSSMSKLLMISRSKGKTNFEAVSLVSFGTLVMEEVVFSLLKRILKSESGKILTNHTLDGCSQKEELNQLRSYIEPHYYPHLDELDGIIEQRDGRYSSASRLRV